MVHSSGGHPESAQDSIRTWESPVYGQVRITGTLANTNVNNSDGVRGYIHQGTTQLWTGDANRVDAASINITAPHDVTVEVNKGDRVAFRVNPIASQSSDGYSWNPRIDYVAYKTYQAGDYWRASEDWTAASNPDDDRFATPAIWRYQWVDAADTSFDPTTYTDMANWVAATSRWSKGDSTSHPDYWCQIYSGSSQHPDIQYDCVRTWTSPVDGVVQINGRLYKSSSAGNGVQGYIHKNDQQLWTGTTLASSMRYQERVAVSVGDKLTFRSNAIGDQNADGHEFNPRITVESIAGAPAHVYAKGDSWQVSSDWTPWLNPDNDSYGTGAVWDYQSAPAGNLNPSSFETLPYFTGSEWRRSDTTDTTHDSGRYCTVNSTGGHPEKSFDGVRTWNSPVAGTVRLSGTLSHASTNGNGVTGSVQQGATSLWSQAVQAGSASFNMLTRVRPGDPVAFRVNSNGDQGSDSYSLNPKVVFMPTTYETGDYWQPTRDWSGGANYQNPDDDWYGKAGVWRYQYTTTDVDLGNPATYDPASYQDMTYWSGSEWRQSSATGSPGRYCTLTSSGGHPEDAQDSIRTWTSPISGTVRITGDLYDANTNGANGVIGYIHQEQQMLWNETVPNAGSQSHDLTVRVRPGDRLSFRVNPDLDQGSDSYGWNPRIDYVGPYGLIGEWKCNEGTGTLAADSSGANYAKGGLPINFTTFTGGAGWTSPGADPQLSALSGSAVRVPFGAEVRADRPFAVAPGHQEITAALWFQYHGSATPDRWRQVIFDNGGAAMLFLQQATGPDGDYWRAAASTHLDIGDGLSWAQASGTTPLEPDTWYQMVMTYDGTETKLYLDGILEATQSVVGTMNPGDKWLRLGYNNADGGADCTLDYIRMWDYALSSEQIYDNYMLVMPEPASMLLLGPAVLALVRRRRRAR